MRDATREILALNKRISAARDRKIRLQSRRETLISSRDGLIEEIKAAGYDPSSLGAERDRLQSLLEQKRREVEEQLANAESILNSIPE